MNGQKPYDLTGLPTCPFCKTDPCRRLRVCFGEKPEIQKVIFRAEWVNTTLHVTAVLVGQSGSFTNPLAVWDSQSGHSAGSWGWYYSTRPASPVEYEDALAKLRRVYAPEYGIQVVRRYTAKERDALHALHACFSTNKIKDAVLAIAHALGFENARVHVAHA